MIKIKNIFNKKDKKEEVKNKKYKYAINFKNTLEIEGICEFENLDEVYDFFLKGNFTQLLNCTKAFYFNSDEIVCLEVYEIKE